MNMRALIFFVVSVILLSRCTTSGGEKEVIKEKELIAENKLDQDVEEAPFQAIQKIMLSQEQAWNSGNLEAFMEGYWKSDSLYFIGKSGVNKGWQNTFDNYQKSYPDTTVMGTLTFTNLEFIRLGPSHASVIGQWHLSRSVGDIGGHYSLIWQKINGKWVIISDHSS